MDRLLKRLQGLRLQLFVAPLSVVALCLAAIRPWFRLGFVCSDDMSFHFLRLAQLQALVQRGVLYSRWAPDMALGYGYPFFNFYAPLSYYAALALSLVTPDLQIALVAAFALATIGAGLSAYLLARDHFSPRASLVAAVAYAYAPYLAYDAYFRANLAETAAWPLLPLALWGIGRLARGSGRRYAAAAALAYAAILLTHNVFALIFSPLLAAYGLASVIAFAPDNRTRCRRLALAGGAILLGLALTTFFWLPALVERAYVHSDRLLVPPVFVYWNNFIRLKELFAAPRAVHPDLLNPSPPRALGLIPALLGLPALIGLWRRRHRAREQAKRQRQRYATLFFAAALLGYAWLTTAGSRVVWDHVPLLEYVQFPWRLLGPAALCLAILIAASADLLSSGADRRGSLVAGAFTLLLIFSSLFWRDPRYCPVDTPDLAPASADAGAVAAYIAQFERDSHTIGTTAKGEYLPRTVQEMPAARPTALLDPEKVPSGATFTFKAEARPIGAHLRITSTEAFTATYNAFYYPGWRVTVDGEAVPITPDTPSGRITFAVPEGTHDVTLRFGETPLRRWANGVSLISLVALLVVALYPTSTASPARRRSPSAERLSPGWIVWGLAIFGIALLLPRLNTPLHRPGLARLATDFPGDVSFEDGLKLLGFNRVGERIPSGADDPGRIDLFWTVWKQPSRRYHRVIEIVGPNGLRWDQGGAIPPRDFREPPPTYAWAPGQYAQDSHTIATLPGAPPGVYDLELVVFNRETLVSARVLSDDGQPGPPSLGLGQLTVARPQRSPTPDEMALDRRLDVRLGPLTLLDARFDRAEAAPGDPFLATWYWLADEQPPADFTARLSLLDGAGNVAATFDAPPTRESHPTSDWRPGDLWVGQHPFHLPARLADGAHAWRLTLHPGDYEVDLPNTLHVTAPQRAFAPPPVDVHLDAAFEDTGDPVATLVGASFDPPPAADDLHPLEPGQALSVTLVWRAEADDTRPTHTSYRVFLHLVPSDPHGRPGSAPVAQSDAVPANWRRPTTGWVFGEYIADPHVLSIPADVAPGDYVLLAGLYDPDGARLTTHGEAGGSPLAIITIQSP